MSPSSKARQEDLLLRIVEDERIDLVVLARYMQVLSPDLCRAMPGRIINIHHSFLPSFKGARPYQQAPAPGDRKGVGEGTSVSVSVDLGGRRLIKKKTTTKNESI